MLFAAVFSAILGFDPEVSRRSLQIYGRRILERCLFGTVFCPILCLEGSGPLDVP